MLRASLFSLLVTACAAAPPPAPAVPAAPSAPPPAHTQKQEPNAVVPQVVPPPPALCAGFAAHPTNGCAPSLLARDALAAALVREDALERDALLACLEPSAELPAASVRAHAPRFATIDQLAILRGEPDLIIGSRCGKKFRPERLIAWLPGTG